MKEIWKSIVGYDGIYKVSNLGRVKSLSRVVLSASGSGKGCRRTLPERILKQHPTGKGKYPGVGLHKDSVILSTTVHALVFKSFCENPNGLPEINHIDGNKSNNRYDNLEPSTRLQNVRHAIATGLSPSMVGESNIGVKLKEKNIVKIRSMFREGMSQTQIAKRMGTTFQNIHCIVRRKSWGHVPETRYKDS
jgi:hypothetical protein